MVSKDPLSELLTSLEQIVFKRDAAPIVLPTQHNAFSECEQLRKSSGLKLDDFARALGVSVAMVEEWESKRVSPTSAELKLMRLMQANPRISKQLMKY